MALPSPVAAIPEMNPRIQAAMARSQSSWDQMAAPTGNGLTQGMADGMAAWNSYGQTAAAPTGGPANGYVATGGGTAGQQAYNNRLRELGVPEHVIEGNGWNIQDESGWNPTASGDGGQSFGFSQHYNDRKDAMFKFASERGVDPSNPVFQADNWWREMQSTHSNAYQRAVSAGTPSGAADAILRYFEMPAETHLNRRSADYIARGSAGLAPTVARYGQ